MIDVIGGGRRRTEKEKGGLMYLYNTYSSCAVLLYIVKPTQVVIQPEPIKKPNCKRGKKKNFPTTF